MRATMETRPLMPVPAARRRGGAALLGLALLGGACQGELKLLNPDAPIVTPGVPDLPDEPKGEVISFLQVNRDMEQPALGCTAQIPACHGGDSPRGVLRLLPRGPTDQAALLSNYEQTKARADLAQPAASPLLTKPLATSPVAHEGGKSYFRSELDTFYVRWLGWVRCGAKREEVKLADCPGGT
jgi:hypothetical protein